MLSGLVVFTLFCLIVIEFIRKIRKRQNLPPGPFRWPIIGNIMEMTIANVTYPHLALAKMAEKYGEVMSIGLGVHDAVVVSSHAAMKDLLSREDLCTGRYEFPYVLDRAFHKNLGILWSSNNVWREMRRFTFKSLRDFGFTKSQAMETTFQEEMIDMIELIKASAAKNDGIVLLDNQAFASNAINTLWNFVAGYRFPTGDEKLVKMLKYNELALEIFGHQNIYSAFPFLKDWFPRLSQHDRHMEMHKDMQGFFQEIIDEIKQKKAKRIDQTSDNFVELFLAQIETSAGNPDSLFTEEQLIVILSDLYLGGSETVSTTLRWAILLITMHPEVQRKVQKEIKITLGDQSISISDASRLPYLKATLYEVLRVGNVIPMNVPRRAMANIYYKDYKIPKDTAVFFNLYPVLNDKEYWRDPHVFRPERFLDTESKIVNTERVAVFGFGKRNCPGESLAMDSLFAFLVTIFRAFSFEVPDGDKLSIENPNSGLAIGPKPFRVKVIVN